MALGMTQAQVDQLMGQRLRSEVVFDHDVVQFGYYEQSIGWSQIGTFFAVFNANRLVSFFNNEEQFNEWYWDTFWKVFKDANTPEATREAMKIQYEQFQANRRAIASNLITLASASAIQRELARQTCVAQGNTICV